MRTGLAGVVCVLFGLAGCGSVVYSISKQAQTLPPVANIGGPYTGTDGKAVSFSGAGSTDPQGEPLTYAWNFGDGSTGTGVSPTHTYAAPGTFNVTLTVTDTSNLSNTATSNATIAAAPPVANAGGPYTGTAGRAVSFSGASSTDPQGETLTYAWNFGDGSTGTGVSPTHTYAAAGTFNVTLTVTDTSNLSNTATSNATIAAAPPPIADAALTGLVYSGQTPIVGAHVYLFAANTTGYGGNGIAASGRNASVSLVSAAAAGASDSVGAYVVTGSNGGFSLTGDYACSAGQQLYLYALGGNAGLGVNSAIGLMAAIGNCPSGSGPAVFATVNEVSTVAAAYAMAGFVTDATHVSSSGTALALVGIGNAFANAANLETLGTGVALAATPAGNGTVPQAEINTLANILAACTSTGATSSNGCSLLLGDALSGGMTGSTPTDTATAAINIAHNPGVNVASLYGTAGGASPFTPRLTGVPNSLTIALNYTGGGLSQPSSVAIDSSGNVWVSNGGARNISKFSPSGSAISGAGGYTGAGLTNHSWGIAIDGSGNVWVTNENNSVSEFNSSGAPSAQSPFSGGGLNLPYRIAIDSSGNVWALNSDLPGSISKLSSSGMALSPATGYGGGLLNQPSGIAIDGSGHVWVANYLNDGFSEFASSGTALSPANAGWTGGGMNEPCCGVAIDASGNVWTANAILPGSISKFSSSGTALSPATGYTGGGLYAPEGIAIDGSGNVWASNSGGYSVSEFSSSGAAISGPAGYTGGGLYSPEGIAIDGSGDVWLMNVGDFSITEFVGPATPVITPIVAGLPVTPTANGSSNLGTRP